MLLNFSNFGSLNYLYNIEIMTFNNTSSYKLLTCKIKNVMKLAEYFYHCLRNFQNQNFELQLCWLAKLHFNYYYKTN